MTKRVVTLIAALALVAGIACGEEAAEPAAVSETLTIEAFDFYFEPTSLAVEPGASVTIEFTNNGEVAHSWTATDLDAELELTGGESGDLTFTAPDEPGSYDFFCKFHPDEMAGTISIGGAEEPAEEAPEEEDDEDVDVDVDTDDDDSDDSGAGGGYDY